MNLPEIGTAIRTCRTLRKQSIRGLSARSGISHQTWTDLEHGRHPPEFDTQRGIAIGLRWPLDWYDRLLVGEDWRAFPDTDHAPAAESDTARIARLEAEVRTLRVALKRLLLSAGDALESQVDELTGEPPDELPGSAATDAEP